MTTRKKADDELGIRSGSVKRDLDVLMEPATPNAPLSAKQRADEELGIRSGSVKRDLDVLMQPATPNVPYPDFCMYPEKRVGKTSCPKDPSCCE